MNGKAIQGTSRTLGPVSDLERHLPSEWWKSLFNSLYLKTDGDVVENTENTVREVDLLAHTLGMEKHDRILDLCCGQGRHCLELARRGYDNVNGIDRSRYLIRLARKRAKQAGCSINFREGDARKLRVPANSFDCVAVMGNSFGYFEQESDDEAVLDSVKRALRSRGMLALDIVDGEWLKDHFEQRSWEWIDQQHFVCRERSLCSDGERIVSREVIVNAELGVIADQFYAERLYSRERITALLDRIGFESVRDHGLVLAGSDRNQDLGMMARRMFITACAPRKETPAKRRKVSYPEVTVLLGDPTLPDSIKRDGRFNSEDVQTVQRLKDSLAELTDYNFKYLDNHVSMLMDLRADPPAFAFNLCDEGYNNKASMELHIPALLEVLGVPYTGGAPGALAICYNKSVVRAYAHSLDVPVPLETYAGADDLGATLPSALPAMVKPNFGDGSFGITADGVVYTSEQLVACLTRLREQQPGNPVLIQEFLTGPEYSVTVLGNPGFGYRVLPILEVDYSELDPKLPPILGYESKWLPDSPYWDKIRYRQADADEETQRRLNDYSTLLFEHLGCRDYARFDFRADAAGEVKFLEVNPNPGWCWDGKVNMMAEYAGLRYSELLELFLQIAQDRVRATANSAARHRGRRQPAAV